MEKLVYEGMYHREKTYWWDIGRRNLVISAIETNHNLDQNSKILDAGCGTGLMLSGLAKRFPQIYGLDFSEEAMKFCKKRGFRNVKKVDFEKDSLGESGSFDAALCLEVMEHVKNHDFFAAQLNKVLKKDGYLYLTVPAYQFLWSHHDEMLWHQRRYNRKAITGLLEKNGFTIIKATHFYSFLVPPAVILFYLLKNQVKDMKSDSIEVGGTFNKILLLVARIEGFLLRFISLPFGLSIFVVAKKD